MTMHPTIAVLLSSYNGARYITEQLRSLESQSYRNFDLFIRDDGSTDATCELIEAFKASSSLSIYVHYDTVNVGALKSFELLLNWSFQEGSTYEYMMFCDQDDIWFENKIERSYHKISAMQERYGSSVPLLVYTDLEIVDADGAVLGSSFWKYFHLDPKKNACNDLAMQCNVTGCTMILNRHLAWRALPFHANSVMHDHWIGLIASSLGVIDFIDDATLSYRQHTTNVSGGAPKFNLSYIVTKALKYYNDDEFDAVLGRQIDQAEGLLEHCPQEDLGRCAEILDAMRRLRSSSALQRLRLVWRYRLFKQGWIRNIGLVFWLIRISGRQQ